MTNVEHEPLPEEPMTTQIDAQPVCIHGAYSGHNATTNSEAATFKLHFSKPGDYLVEFQTTAFGPPTFIGARLAFDGDRVAESRIYSNNDGEHRACGLGHGRYSSSQNNQVVVATIKPLTDSTRLDGNDDYFVKITPLR